MDQAREGETEAREWDKVYSTEEWKKLKWDLGQIFMDHIHITESGAIEGNPSIHRMAQYAWRYSHSQQALVLPGMRWRDVNTEKLPDDDNPVTWRYEDGCTVFTDLNHDMDMKDVATFLAGRRMMDGTYCPITHWLDETESNTYHPVWPPGQQEIDEAAVEVVNKIIILHADRNMGYGIFKAAISWYQRWGK